MYYLSSRNDATANDVELGVQNMNAEDAGSENRNNTIAVAPDHRLGYSRKVIVEAQFIDSTVLTMLDSKQIEVSMAFRAFMDSASKLMNRRQNARAEG